MSEDAPARRAAPTSAATEPATDPAIGALRPFDCLWCGRTWQPRGADDLATLARLCPDCLGRADSNPFIRFRLHAALEARAATAGAESAGAATAALLWVPARERIRTGSPSICSTSGFSIISRNCRA